jgi:hypothetical protein
MDFWVSPLDGTLLILFNLNNRIFHLAQGDVEWNASFDVGESEHRLPLVSTPVSRFGDHGIPIILTTSAVFLCPSRHARVLLWIGLQPPPFTFFTIYFNSTFYLLTLCHLRIENVVWGYNREINLLWSKVSIICMKLYRIIFIVAPCILKIHWVLHTNKCTNCIIY